MRKNNLFILLSISVGILLSLPSCSNDDDQQLNLEKEEQERYNKFITPEMEVALTALEMPIHRGITPPKIEGFYRMEPILLATTNSSEDHYTGTNPFKTDYKFNFYNQKNLTISMIGYEVVVKTDKYYNKHTGNGIFISGHDNVFSVFLEEEVVYEGIGTPRTLTVISGEVVKSNKGEITGVKELRYAFIMKDTDGVTSILKEGQGRVIGDDDVEKITKEEFETLEGAPKSTSYTNYTDHSFFSKIDI